MATMMIKDLTVSHDLDGQQMATVVGGTNYGNIFKGSGWMPSLEPGKMFAAPSQVTNSASQDNSINQGGNVQIVNTLAGGGICVDNSPFALGLNLNGSAL